MSRSRPDTDQEWGLAGDELGSGHHEGPDHRALLYTSREEQLATVVPFLREGLARGQQCLYVADDSEAPLLEALGERGIDVETALESGSLTVTSPAEVYPSSEPFDPAELVAYYESVIDEYEPCRVAVETTWLQESGIDLDAFFEFESRVNHLLADRDCLALCQYDRTAFPPAVVEAIIETHPTLVVDGAVRQNPYYRPPAERQAEESSATVDRMLETLAAQPGGRRGKHQRYLERLYEITADPELDFPAQLQGLFELGCEIFDLDCGMLARIDPDTDLFEVEYTSDGQTRFTPGTTLDLSETFCGVAVESGGTLRVRDATLEGYADLDACRELGMESYVGTSIELDGDCDRSVCFVATEPRDRAVSATEWTFTRLMAQWLQGELQRQVRERELARARDHFKQIFEHSNDAIFITDPYADELVDANEAGCELLGYSREELLARGPSDFHPDEMPAFRAFVDDVFAEGTGWTAELTCLHRDGSRIPVEISASRIDAGDRQRMLAVVRDISERKTHERYQRALYDITSARELSFEEKIDQLLQLGCDRFDLDQGYLGQYVDGRFETVHAVGPTDDDVRDGTGVQPNEGQFCRRTIHQDEPLGASDVVERGWDDDPVYEEWGLDSYFGVKVTDGANPYGTLSFCDTDTRDPFTEAEHTFLELLGQWVSYELTQRRHDRQLAAINELGRDLTAAQTRTEIVTATADHAATSLSLPLTAVFLYDEETGQLRPTAQTPRAATHLPTETLCAETSGPAWQAFVTGERQVASGQKGADHLMAVPLDQQGVLLTAATEGGTIDTDLVAAVAATVESALARADRERRLRDREAELEGQNDRLERLNCINTTIRRIDQALVAATTRQEIEETVCDHLAAVEPYDMAWIGRYDTLTGELTPSTWAGTRTDYLDEITVTAGDEPTGKGPGGRAIETGEPQIVDDLVTDQSFEPWREAALTRGFRSVIVLPLAYENTLYGLLVVYADQPGVFDDHDHLVEMADTIAYAINAVESKKALVSDEVTRLDFTVADSELEIVELARELDCTFSLERLVPRSDGGLRVFFSTHGAAVADVLSFASRLAVTDLSLISSYDHDGEPVGLFEATLSAESLCATVQKHGGCPRTVAVEDGTGIVTIEVAADANVREFVEMFQRTYPESELTGQRTHQQPQQTPQEFRSTVMAELTPRQREILEIAYYNGYFEEPRARTASEIAATLDIAQPTLTSHLRTAQRKLFEQLFADPLDS